MKTIIVTPLYYIGKDLVNLITTISGDIAVLITDDVSPIFPIDTRMDWLERTVYFREIEMHSLVQSDESKEFKDAVEQAVKALDKDAEVIYFLTKDAHKNLKKVKNKHFFRSPLDPEVLDQLDVVFSARFIEDFKTFTKPKSKEIPQTESNKLIPYFIKDGKTYYGFVYDYVKKNVDALGVLIPYKATVAETDAYISVYTKKYFGTPTGTKRLIGWVNDSYWAIEIEIPEYYNEENGARKFLALDADLVFFESDYMKKIDNPLLHWVKNRAEEVEEALPDDVKI